MRPVEPGWRMKGEASQSPIIPLEGVGTWTEGEQTQGGDEQLARKIEIDLCS